MSVAMDPIIRTGRTIKDGKRVVYDLDNPAHRQRYAKYMNPKEKARFARDYLRAIVEAEKYERWYRKMLRTSR
jgi:hypothetical protein